MNRRAFLLDTAVFPAAFAQSEITAFGARPGNGDSRTAIQKAIDECAAGGGGMVHIPCS
jgi:polygalacturonase